MREDDNDKDETTNTDLTTKRNDTYVERHQGGNDPYTQFAEQDGPAVRGALLSCKNGVWTIGREDPKPVKGEPRFLFIMPSILIGWLKWRDKIVVGHDIGYVRDGFRMKRRYELDDNDDSKWALDDDGEPSDPWSMRFMALLVELSPHADHTFVSGAWGAYIAFRDLAGRYRERPAADMQPVVSLTTHTRPNKKKGGFITGPWFNIEGWATPEDVKAGRKAGATPKASPRKAKAKVTPDVEQPAAWGSAKS